MRPCAPVPPPDRAPRTTRLRPAGIAASHTLASTPALREAARRDGSNRSSAAKRAVIPVQPERDPRGAGPIAAFVIQAVRLFARLEDARAIVQPPARLAQTFERFGASLVAHRRFERVLRLFPRPACESVAATLHVVGRHSSAVYARRT